MEIKELINKMLKGESENVEERTQVFIYLRHIPNIHKTNEEFELYCEMTKRVGLPTPNRNSGIRPLHEKYDEKGNLIITW